MRTYDKLIATIPARQGAGDLRTCLGVKVQERDGPRRAVARSVSQVIDRP
ncbi:hypothetical protein M8A51_13820 [Schlegelella sp. S2-27]|uniref:Uncharacterized protein n=1 Tax=Caldimonas mangrovi TaxID=2944811 RepID=A0ABT0YPG2_9BURK|nr:hypothetical protein [Caldimonas mangrovi]MCM5680606.1 hypothetical protein [Caldimonas mangrovi]